MNNVIYCMGFFREELQFSGYICEDFSQSNIHIRT